MLKNSLSGLKLLLTVLAIVFSIVEAQAQYTIARPTSVPVFEGCEVNLPDSLAMACLQYGMLKHIARSVEYPEKVRKRGIQGRIFVNFIVEATGHIAFVELKSCGAHPLLEIAAIEAVQSIPPCTEPAYFEGKPVRMSYTLPINFRLQ